MNGSAEKGARLVASLKYRNLRYTKNHPLRIPRVSLLLEFLRAMELISDSEVVESRPATDEEVLLFHEPEYLQALKEADQCRCVPPGARERFNIGNYENPVSDAMLRGSLLATGSSIQTADLFLKGYKAFNPAGGMHHAFPSKANGFCFINDPGVTIEYLRRGGFKRILYIDLDAHHCDGVQEFYYETDEVYVVSLHQSPGYAFPFTKGFIHERGEGKGKGYNLNIPLPKEVNDSEYLYILEKVISCLGDVFVPDIYILQLGTDPLMEDPLSKWKLSNAGFIEAFRIVRDRFGEGVYLGGGGYNPISLTRAWTLLWCELSQREAPSRIHPEGENLLRSVEWEDFEENEDEYPYLFLKDPFRGGEIRKEIKDLALRVKSLIYS